MSEVIKTCPKMTAPSIGFEVAREVKNVCKNTIHILGFEFDGTACFRKGTVKGPNAIRDMVYGIEYYSPYIDRDLEDIPSMVDLGNLPITHTDDVDADWSVATNYFYEIFDDIDLEANGVKVLTLGGEHSISYAPIKKYLEQYPNLVLIHLDAHADLRDGYEGHHYSHASIIRRSLDHFGDGHRLIQYGIRSGTGEEFQYMRENKTLVSSRSEFLEIVGAIDANTPIYVTLDLDYFDPSILPGTGTPEPGGEDFHSFISLLKILKNKKFVGADVVELSPEIDSTENSSVFATKVVREILLTL